MLDFLKPMKNEPYDFLTFLAGDKKNSIHIQGTEYKDPGEKVGGSSLGDSYHVVLFKDHKTDKDKYDELDTFEAILCEPLEYISTLIPAGFYGIIARKTTTSHEIMEKLLDNIRKTL
jgi:hypothetical protein